VISRIFVLLLVAMAPAAARAGFTLALIGDEQCYCAESEVLAGQCPNLEFKFRDEPQLAAPDCPDPLIFPDTKLPEHLEAIYELIGSNPQGFDQCGSSSLPIRFVSNVGDVMQEWDPTNEFHIDRLQRTQDLTETWIAPKFPFAIPSGNHDVFEDPVPGIDFDEFFGSSWHSAVNQGHESCFDDFGTCTQLFSADDIDYVHVSLGYTALGPSPEQIAYLEGRYAAYPGRPFVLTQHSYLIFSATAPDGWERTEEGEALWNNFIKSKDRVFLVISGHRGAPTYGKDQNDSGTDVAQLVMNYQHFNEGWMGWLEVDHAGGQVRGYSYSPVLDQCADDPPTPFNRPERAVWQLDFAPTPLSECNDGIDNDGDGTIDWDGTNFTSPDPGCLGLALESEIPVPEPEPIFGYGLMLLLGAVGARQRDRVAPPPNQATIR